MSSLLNKRLHLLGYIAVFLVTFVLNLNLIFILICKILMRKLMMHQITGNFTCLRKHVPIVIAQHFFVYGKVKSTVGKLCHFHDHPIRAHGTGSAVGHTRSSKCCPMCHHAKSIYHQCQAWFSHGNWIIFTDLEPPGSYLEDIMWLLNTTEKLNQCFSP